MVFLSEIGYIITVMLHVLSAVVAVGAVTVTDYLHLIGLRSRKLELRLLEVYHLLAKLITWALAVIILTGTILVINNPSVLYDTLFRLKIALVFIVSVNGLFLHQKVSPLIEKAVRTKKHGSKVTLINAALGGSVSITSWYGIFILSLTKVHDYPAIIFIDIYIITIIILFFVALYVEKKARIL